MAGDEAFRALAAAHGPRLLRTATRILGDRGEAEDAAQDALLVLHRHRGRVAADRVGAWLDRVVANAAIDRLRRRCPLPVAQVPDAPAEDPALDREAAAEERRRLRAAVAELPPRQREVVRLRLTEQRTFREIQAQLGISDGAAKTHFKRAVRTLTRRLRPRDE